MMEEVEGDSDSFESESIDNELLRNVVKYNEDVPKRRRISVNLFKMKKSQHILNSEDLSKPRTFNSESRLKIPKLWQSFARRTLMLTDPFRSFKIAEIPTEEVVRYLYDSISKSWETEKAIVKMEKESFNRGAMRECFRLKKIPTYTDNKGSLDDWKKAGNYVCKRYMENVSRDVYFEDVRLQMDAKLWAEEFNHQPGVRKEVDIVRMCIIEFINREDKPLYHLEHFIEGNYIKYNSNSGFVDENSRNTPQAFSHFTFERSGHILIVVDIQGVGDLYTDPQIHTACKTGYGNGNLGPRGMALFFHSHQCNFVCDALGLAKFDLSPLELKQLGKSRGSSITSETVAIVQKSPLKSLRSSKPSNSLESALINMVEEHLNEENYETFINDFECHSPALECHRGGMKDHSLQFQVSSPDSGYDNDNDICSSIGDYFNNNDKVNSQRNTKKQAQFHFDTLNSEECKNTKDTLESYMKSNHVHRPSCVAQMDMSSLRVGESILGEIHHEISKLHESGRLYENIINSEASIDWESVLFHEEIAANLNCMEAMLNISSYFLGLPSKDLLKSCPIQTDPEKEFFGWIYLTRTAEAGHRPSIMILADHNDVTQSQAKGREPDWYSVIHWLEKMLDTIDQSDESGEFDSINENSSYIVKARMAAMFRTGGYGLDRDIERAAELYSEAADEATAAMNGRLASKYYELAEEVYGEME